MENTKWSVRALAANMRMSIDELADTCGISRAHLKQVSAGNVVMTARDLKALSKATAVPCDNIFVKDFDE